MHKINLARPKTFVWDGILWVWIKGNVYPTGAKKKTLTK